MVVCLVLVAGFFGLLSIVLPGAGMMGLAMLVLFVFFWLQYVVWGRWLYGYAVRIEERQQVIKESPAEALLSAQQGAEPAGDSESKN